MTSLIYGITVVRNVAKSLLEVLVAYLKTSSLQARRWSRKTLTKKLSEILRLLKRYYPVAECALIHADAYQLLVATILSAQCTDQRVNQVTPLLFKKYPNAKSLAKAKVEDVEEIIRSTGFFKNKAKNLLLCTKTLVEKFNGEVPNQLESLVQLAGVGRKTANVVLGTFYGIPSGVVVDTHVSRLTRRLGLTKSENPVDIERDLMKILPENEWIMFSHRLIHHGRAVCKARKPDCQKCGLFDICPRIEVDLK